MSIIKITLWAAIIWILPIMYFVLANETKFKKNIAVGVTLPFDGRSDPEVLARLARFRRELRLLAAALLAAAVACVLIPSSDGVTMTLWLVWTELCVVLFYVPYISCNRDMKKIKEARGWKRKQERTVTVDLSAAAQPYKELSVFHFLLPFLVSLAPCVYEIGWGEPLTGAFLLLDAACILLFYCLYRWGFRKRADVVDSDASLTAALTRLRRQAWRRCWLWGSWFMGLLNGALWLLLRQSRLGLLALAVLTVGFVAAMFFLEFSLRKAQERLTRESGKSCYVDEDDKWIWGMFYYDPNDCRLMVNARVGMNSTVNLARRGGQVLTVFSAALLLLLPLMGVWMMCEERAAVTVAVSDGTLTATHSGSSYTILLDEIESVELLPQLPSMRRVVGTGMEAVLKGQFRSDELGLLTVCLDPRTGPYLLVQARDGTLYLLGASRDGAVQEVFAVLADG